MRVPTIFRLFVTITYRFLLNFAILESLQWDLPIARYTFQILFRNWQISSDQTNITDDRYYIQKLELSVKFWFGLMTDRQQPRVSLWTLVFCPKAIQELEVL